MLAVIARVMRATYLDMDCAETLSREMAQNLTQGWSHDSSLT